MSIGEIVISIISIVVALVVGGGQIYIAKRMKDFETRQDSRDEKRRQDEIYAEATRFIQKYSKSNHESDILLLPYCVMAYRYNSIYPYRREIYREFCSLTEDVQNEILKRCELNLDSHKETDCYYSLLNIMLDVLKTNYPDNRDIFYEGGKYFHRALLNSGTKLVPEVRCVLDSDELEFRKSPFGTFNKSSDMDYHSHITNMLAYHKDEKPIDILFSEETSMGRPDSADEILISYLCCQIAKYIMIYSNNNEDDRNLGYADDFAGKLYMEDLFLEVLHIIDNYRKE